MQHKQQRCAGLQGLGNIFDESSFAASHRASVARRFTHWVGGDGGGNERQSRPDHPMRKCGLSHDLAAPFSPAPTISPPSEYAPFECATCMLFLMWCS